MVTKRLRVLIADDTPGARLMVKMALTADQNVEVVGEAANGAQAVEMAKSECPDVMLLDIAMPVMDGLTAIPLIQETCPETKILVFSGFAASDLAEKALKLGAHGYVEKGAPLHELTERVRALADN